MSKLEFTHWEEEFFAMLDGFSNQFPTQQKAADALGISLNSFNSYKHRYRHPKYATVQRLKERMEVMATEGQEQKETAPAQSDDKDATIAQLNIEIAELKGEIRALEKMLYRYNMDWKVSQHQNGTIQRQEISVKK